MGRDVLVCQGCGFLLDWDIRDRQSYCPHCNRTLNDAKKHTIPDSTLKGTDPGDEEAAMLADANREMFGDEVAELMDLGILPDDIGAK